MLVFSAGDPCRSPANCREYENLMLGGQQIRAYKTIMKRPRYMPRHTESDVRLFRVIAWGAVILLAAFVAAIVAAKISSFEYTSEPVFAFVIPIALILLFCWWLIDVAPVISRWLVALVAFVASIGCLAFAWIQPVWEQVQLAALVIYLVAVSRVAWRQIRAGVGKENEAADALKTTGCS